MDEEAKVCVRCGRAEKIQNHHILPRIEGGGDEPENKESKCEACHDFEHAKRNILKSIKSWERKLKVAHKLERILAIRARLQQFKHRLEVLESLNTPAKIKETGKYTSYWVDQTTHDIPTIPASSIEIKCYTCAGSGYLMSS